MLKFLWFWAFFSISAEAFEVISHRGIHQNFDTKNNNNETCTATKIHFPSHQYLENTIASIEKAFDLGADIVEVDIHPTNEENGGHDIVVFHDWTLDCRTNSTCKTCRCNSKSQCVTHEQSLSYIKTLDAGYGYTYDNGKTYPFRGKYVAKIPSLKDVLNLLETHPDKKILINVKDKFKYTVEIFINRIKKYPKSVRSRLLFPRYYYIKELKELGVVDTIYAQGKAKKCFLHYILYGWTGYVPNSCRNISIFVPTKETLKHFSFLPGFIKKWKATSVLWGWPDKFIKRLHKNGSKVYASQVNSVKEFDAYQNIPLDGIMTDKIALLAERIT